jgi:hypothetical protein
MGVRFTTLATSVLVPPDRGRLTPEGRAYCAEVKRTQVATLFGAGQYSSAFDLQGLLKGDVPHPDLATSRKIRLAPAVQERRLARILDHGIPVRPERLAIDRDGIDGPTLGRPGWSMK